LTRPHQHRDGGFSLRNERKEHVRFGANFKYDTRRGGLGIVYSLRTSLDIGAHAVVVARSEGAEVGETMEGDGVLGRRETECGGVPVDAALSDVIGSLCADKEAIMTKHGIGGECGTLCSKSES
jgi:hypothetical protein